VLSLPAAQVEEEPATLRLRFEGVTVGIDQASAEVRVELSLGGRETVGEATGSSSGREIQSLVARAALDAVTKFLEPIYALTLNDLKVVPTEEGEVALVTVRFLKGREHKTLTGSCPVSHSLQQAIVYATLSALNRVLGRVSYREPVEYEVRPTVY
jgi:hypothetical protein